MYIQTNLLDISKTMLIAIPLWYIYTTIRKKRFKIRREIFVSHFNDIVTYYDLVQDMSLFAKTVHLPFVASQINWRRASVVKLKPGW